LFSEKYTYKVLKTLLRRKASSISIQFGPFGGFQKKSRTIPKKPLETALAPIETEILTARGTSDGRLQRKAGTWKPRMPERFAPKSRYF
jgi:hypothetical protein